MPGEGCGLSKTWGRGLREPVIRLRSGAEVSHCSTHRNKGLGVAAERVQGAKALGRGRGNRVERGPQARDELLAPARARWAGPIGSRTQPGSAQSQAHHVC